jgi:glycolate oxidase iron-sulfur subunit
MFPEQEQEELRRLLGDCVHCGFCLPACPTYALWGEEMDSPRGRIHLVGQVLSGAAVAGPVARHLDACLSCMACVTACPSGVRYDEIIELSRQEVEATVRRRLPERLARSLIFGLFPYPRRLRAARLALVGAERAGLRSSLKRPGLARRLPALLRSLEALAPPAAKLERLPLWSPAKGSRRGLVSLLAGCVQSVFFSHINTATARVLTAEGFDVTVPAGQGCCGALSWHSGRKAQATSLAKKTVDVLRSSGADFIVVSAAGCGSAMKEYPRLLSAEPGYDEKATWVAERTRDISELLARCGARAPRQRLEAKVAYHDACHLAHAQGVRAEPRALLQQVPGISLLELADQHCCGSAGVYNLLQPAAARELAERKAQAVLATGADAVVTTNPGCLAQMRSALDRCGSTVKTLHLVEVLDASIAGRREL